MRSGSGSGQRVCEAGTGLPCVPLRGLGWRMRRLTARPALYWGLLEIGFELDNSRRQCAGSDLFHFLCFPRKVSEDPKQFSSAL